MNFDELNKYVLSRYGLKFEPIVSGSKLLHVLLSPTDSSYFAMASRIEKKRAHLPGSGQILVLDLRCGELSNTIIDLPGFSSAFRLKSQDWVGIWLDQADKETVKKAFDYAFKLAMNNSETVMKQEQYLFIPGEKIDTKYQTQKIKIPKYYRRLQPKPPIPAAIQKMKSVYDYSILPSKGRSKNFYHQGKLMADYDDNYEKEVPFHNFYPTYQRMKIDQLRYYFTWRKNIKAKKYVKTDKSYAYVYIYELLNQIGVSDPVDGFNKLQEFMHEYVEKYELEIKANLLNWFKDYAIYYQLPIKIASSVFVSDIKTDEYYHRLLHPSDYSSEEILKAFQNFSPYLDKCLALKKKPQQFSQVLKTLWINLLKAKKQSGISYFKHYFAQNTLTQLELFKNAVFYLQYKNKEFVYEVDAERKYYFRQGELFVKAFTPSASVNSELNTLMHEVDRLMRLEFNLGRVLKPRKIATSVLAIIKESIAENQRKQLAAQKPKIEINFANLQQIRIDAEITKENLLTDEEKALITAANQPVEINQTPVKNEAVDDYDLSTDEKYLLLSLLKKSPYQVYLKQKHLMASVLIDQINEKMFDEFGDNIIDFSENDQPQIIADYEAELAEIFL